ncbi:MAG: hypothetical protein NT093_04760 [Candidatus Moranbacteria bacterium]|nr:hypothetical protein [Candidatus Moranbacteria bacterium]
MIIIFFIFGLIIGSFLGAALVLFDIDGTLVLTGRAGVRALERALTEVCGRADMLADVAIAGNIYPGSILSSNS